MAFPIPRFVSRLLGRPVEPSASEIKAKVDSLSEFTQPLSKLEECLRDFRLAGLDFEVKFAPEKAAERYAKDPYGYGTSTYQKQKEFWQMVRDAEHPLHKKEQELRVVASDGVLLAEPALLVTAADAASSKAEVIELPRNFKRKHSFQKPIELRTTEALRDHGRKDSKGFILRDGGGQWTKAFPILGTSAAPNLPAEAKRSEPESSPLDHIQLEIDVPGALPTSITSFLNASPNVTEIWVLSRIRGEGLDPDREPEQIAFAADREEAAAKLHELAGLASAEAEQIIRDWQDRTEEVVQGLMELCTLLEHHTGDPFTCVHYEVRVPISEPVMKLLTHRPPK